MKILLYSYSFWPNIGGVEDVGHSLAKGLVEAGHEVTVVTETASDNHRLVPYTLVRRPGLIERAKLVADHDIVHSNGSSVSLFFLATLLDKPFSWTHHGYQLQCVDGAGWVAGKPAPMTPLASFRYHLHLFGFKAIPGGIKLWLRRLVGLLADANVAASLHQERRQPLPRQWVIYNPIEVDDFKVGSAEIAKANLAKSQTSFTFIGRLISEKGVDDLLYALAYLNNNEQHRLGSRSYTLQIIGDGPQLQFLQELCSRLDLDGHVWFRGSLTGKELFDAINEAGVCVLPSAWEEPGALIVMELLAAGKPMIVSRSGWLSECALDACRTFPNRDRIALARTMDEVINDKPLQETLIEKAINRFNQFDPKKQVAEYVELFELMLKKDTKL
ncbi:MAG: glycosyltransferase family 4 protein [Candidatus Obscuribacterales bacterium]|nr:glycosyltransferase family 4 protein [Candidatus Obscuribacterales bacterium]